jgi:uncharacterized protein
MATGLLALLDDVAAIAKLAAASLDDVAAAAGKAGTKAAGLVIDDTAVTPRYVMGLAPERELPIIAKIARGSLRNKLLFITPIALLLSAVAPWAITPILMLGGGYLCFEAAEKLIEAFGGGHGAVDESEGYADAAEMEEAKITSAVRTDLILSAEIMAITLAQLPEQPLVMQAIILLVVGIGMTVLVYGLVGLIVKMDDIGLKLAQGNLSGARALGRGLVAAMPILLAFLGVVGTAAMAWVGGGIVVHGLEHFGMHLLPDFVHGAGKAAAALLPAIGGFAGWLGGALASGLIGVAIGGAIAAIVHVVHKLRHRH